MNSAELEEKIVQARRVHRERFEPLPVKSIRELVVIRRMGTDPYLTFRFSKGEEVRLNYQQFVQAACGVAQYMQSIGLKSGERIATAAHNHWHTALHYYAAWMLGCVIVPINLGEDDKRIHYILTNAKVKHAFIHQTYEKRLKAILNGNGLAKITSTIFGNDLDYAKPNSVLPTVPKPIGLETEALIVYTSGTTGNPKGVVLTQRNLLEDARAISDWHKIDARTRMMCVLPIHHVNGTVVTLLTPFYAGSSVVLNEKFSSSTFFKVVAEEHVHIVSMVPTLLQYLLHEFEKTQPESTPLFRHVICGAGPLTVGLAKQFEDRFSIPIVHGYGLSETTCYSCFLPIDLQHKEHQKWMRNHGYPSIGVPVLCNEMAIHDREGKPMMAGERGEIVIRGHNVMKGYYNNEEANQEAFTNDWFRSGDEGFFLKDEAGRPFYFITGRIKELIIRGGVNLAPLEIDEIINRAPGVKAAIAVGFENQWYGEEVGAYVQLNDDALPDEQAIIDFCLEHLPWEKSPKVVVFGEHIPVTSTGKYQRMKVADAFKRWKKTQFRRPPSIEELKK